MPPVPAFPAHPLKPPLSPFYCFLSLPVPLPLIAIFLYAETSMETGGPFVSKCLESWHGPRSHHDAKIHPTHLPGVAWGLRPGWSHTSPYTWTRDWSLSWPSWPGTQHHPESITPQPQGVCSQVTGLPLPPLASPWERSYSCHRRGTPQQHRICSPLTETHSLCWSGRGGETQCSWKLHQISRLASLFEPGRTVSAQLPGRLLGLYSPWGGSGTWKPLLDLVLFFKKE